MTKVVLKLESEEILKSMATIIHIGDKNYYYMPYWFEKGQEEGEYIVHRLEKELPIELTDAILKIRER